MQRSICTECHFCVMKGNEVYVCVFAYLYKKQHMKETPENQEGSYRKQEEAQEGVSSP